MRLRCRIGWHKYQLVNPGHETLAQAIQSDLDAAFNMDRFRCIYCDKEECQLTQEAQQRMHDYWVEHRWDFSMKSVDGLVDAAFTQSKKEAAK